MFVSSGSFSMYGRVIFGQSQRHCLVIRMSFSDYGGLFSSHQGVILRLSECHFRFLAGFYRYWEDFEGVWGPCWPRYVGRKREQASMRLGSLGTRSSWALGPYLYTGSLNSSVPMRSKAHRNMFALAPYIYIYIYIYICVCMCIYIYILYTGVGSAIHDSPHFGVQRPLNLGPK